MPVTLFSFSRSVLIATVSFLLALHALLAISATIDLGITGDETVHLTGGYSYWRFNDYRLHPENGNLPQRWAALPLLALRPTLEPGSQPELWARSDVWRIGQQFFFESGNTIDYVLLWARTAMVVWSVATGLLVFFWSRGLWGDAGGVFSLALFILSPTTLAHGALVTSDMCATFWLLAATGAWWRVTKRVTVRRIVPSLIAIGAASVSKFSVGVLVPVFALIAGWRLIETQLSSKERKSRDHKTRHRIVSISFLTGCHVAAVFACIWLCYGFRYTAFDRSIGAGAEFFSSGSAMLPSKGLARAVLSSLQEHTVLPAAFEQGLTYVVYAARERPAFAAGEYDSTGWWWFFPFAVFVKSSLAELLMIFALPAWAARRWISHKLDLISTIPLIPLLVFAFIYGAFAITSHLNIGHRHVLPLYPVLYILAGSVFFCRKGGDHPSDAKKSIDALNATIRRADSERLSPTRIAFGWAVIALALVEVYATIPHYLTYFNRIAGGPAAGRFLLGDSSLDWGQGLPRLASWLRTHRHAGETLYLSYFGADDPNYRGIGATELAPYYSFGRERRFENLRGGLYCIGISMLQDAASPYKGPWTRESESRYQALLRQYGPNLTGRVIASGDEVNMGLWDLDRARFARLLQLLRVQAPLAVVDESILIFRLSQRDVDDATSGSLTQLMQVIERNSPSS
jgi:4-amino-4-deoxy-L-arabinose transferase-like glycosyltransferase